MALSGFIGGQHKGGKEMDTTSGLEVCVYVCPHCAAFSFLVQTTDPLMFLYRLFSYFLVTGARGGKKTTTMAQLYTVLTWKIYLKIHVIGLNVHFY